MAASSSMPSAKLAAAAVSANAVSGSAKTRKGVLPEGRAGHGGRGRQQSNHGFHRFLLLVSSAAEKIIASMETTVRKALLLIEHLARSREPRRLTDISREMGLTKPNVYRLLSTLCEMGYARKDPVSSQYAPTLKLWELGSILVRDIDLVTVAHSRLRKLCDDTGESVQLTVFDAGFAVYVDKVDSRQPLKATTNIGTRLPATAISTGKAMLAWMPDEALTLALANLQRFTPSTRMKREEIEADLELTRERGYAVNFGEYRGGICGVGFPIRDRMGGVVAAIGIWGAEENILGPRREDLVRMGGDSAREISYWMGYIDPAATPPT
jgi:DNA-binding IclR family transcriptional regulator